MQAAQLAASAQAKPGQRAGCPGKRKTNTAAQLQLGDHSSALPSPARTTQLAAQVATSQINA
jgi:hypothetical protein